MSLQERVRKGALFLDERVPGWRRRVNPRRLDMSSHKTKDLFGQIFGTFIDGYDELGFNDTPEELLADLGFELSYEEIRDTMSNSAARTAKYAELTEAWRIELSSLAASQST